MTTERHSKRKTLCQDDSEAQLARYVIGSHYMVLRKENVLNEAEILEKRYGDAGVELYVHYIGLDRRLDEWINNKQLQGDQIVVSDELLTPEIPDKKITRNQKKLLKRVRKQSAEPIPLDPDELERKQLTNIRHIDKIQFGNFEIDTWYFSPYPEEYQKQKKLYICEFCLKYMKLEKTYRYHLGECSVRQPPGKLIYHKGTLSIHETDPVEHGVYCQNLSLLGKLFLDHKSLYYDVGQFYFYILCEVDKQGSHLVGYFSKEKESSEKYNVACIMTLPPFQRQGYGKLLIAFSYELSKLEGTVGTPEKPLSDLGRLSYKSFWCWSLLDILRDLEGSVTIRELTELTSMTETDLYYTLESMELVRYWQNEKKVVIPFQLVEDLIHTTRYKRPRLTVDPSAIRWTPPNKSTANNHLTDSEYDTS